MIRIVRVSIVRMVRATMVRATIVRASDGMNMLSDDMANFPAVATLNQSRYCPAAVALKHPQHVDATLNG